jgi:hypothetical protein
MDPLTLQASNLGVVRPAIALHSDLSAVLREGRVLAGEVLQSFGGGAFLIGIGRHRVPADGPVGLEEGHRFLFVVEGEGEALALRVLSGRAGDEPALLRALREALGQDQPLGRLLQGLLAALAGGGSEAEALAAELARLTTGGGTNVDPLAERLAGSAGLAFESRLAVAASLGLPPAEASRLGAELEAWILGRLTTGGARASSPGAELLQGLRAEVAALLGADGSSASREAAFAAWLAAGEPGAEHPAPSLARLLEAGLRRLLSGVQRDEALARLHAAPLATLGRGLELLVVRRLLDLGAPPRALVEEQVRGALERARSDLKGRLLGALERLGEGSARTAVLRTVQGLEAEQLLDLARARGGEPTHYSLPLADGEGWTTAHLFVEPRRCAEEPTPGACEDPAWRLGLAVELSRTGALRADLLARPGELLVRVRASRPEVVAALAAGLPEVEARLAVGGRRVHVTLAAAPESELVVEPSAADVGYLRRHHVMDLSA